MARTAATTGFSLEPDERAALDEFQQLIGVGSRTEALRRYFLADLPRVNARLRALRDGGLEPSARPALDQLRVAESEGELSTMYRSTWDGDVEDELAAVARAPAFR
ncbi:hypothetical protein BH23CHL7_BH23CHL7_16560 [soil metagenome]